MPPNPKFQSHIPDSLDGSRSHMSYPSLVIKTVNFHFFLTHSYCGLFGTPPTQPPLGGQVWKKMFVGLGLTRLYSILTDHGPPQWLNFTWHQNAL